MVCIILLLLSELHREFSFYPWKVLVSHSDHWDKHDHRVTWQYLRFALKSFWCNFNNLEWPSCKCWDSSTWMFCGLGHFLKIILLQCSCNHRANSLFLTSAVGWGCTKLQISDWWHCHVCNEEERKRDGRERREEVEAVSNTCKWKLSQLDNKPGESWAE